LPQGELLRFVRSPDGLVVPDVAGKLPGRGAWVRATRQDISRAIDQRLFSRAFKAPSTPMPDMLGVIEKQLLERCIGLIGFARKGGSAVTGFDQVRASLRKKEPGWILTAFDSAEDSRNKVHFLARSLYEDVKIAGALDSAELGMAFGRPSVVHALIEPAPVCEAFSVAYKRLTGFRSAPESKWLARWRS
jgi:predicted RNA-binding protein YlxR (DUF448 family)